MKTPLRISLFFISGICIIFLVYFIIRYNIRLGNNDTDENLISENNELEENNSSEESNISSDNEANTAQTNKSDLNQTENSTQDIAEATANQNVILQSTEYIQIEYDINTEEEYYYQLDIPSDWVGLTREELETYMEDYLASPSEEDIEKCLINLELITFSAEKVLLRKVFDNKEEIPLEVYHVKSPDGYITICYPDTETIYFETSIVTRDLPVELQQEIEDGKYFTTQDELYYFLESYTS